MHTGNAMPTDQKLTKMKQPGEKSKLKPLNFSLWSIGLMFPVSIIIDSLILHLELRGHVGELVTLSPLSEKAVGSC